MGFFIFILGPDQHMLCTWVFGGVQGLWLVFRFYGLSSGLFSAQHVLKM
jgi:hypothetical protein